jgi:sulfur-oxidizing protein SoxX
MAHRFSLILASSLAMAALGAAAQAPTAPAEFVQRNKGNCIACHQLPEGVSPVSRADLGPRLAGARMRELGRAKLRELLQDPTRANPDTVMPPFGRHRILEPAEIDRVVEYLHALP